MTGSPNSGPGQQKVGAQGTKLPSAITYVPLPVLLTPTLGFPVPFSLGNLVLTFPNTHLIMSFAAEDLVLPLLAGDSAPHHCP